MDITVLFRACVKTVRMRNKALGVTVTEPDKNRILNASQQRKSQFSAKAKDIVSQISRLRDFLLEHRKAYLNLTSYLSDGPQMSDVERDKIDAGAQRIMKTCSALIHDFRRQAVQCDVSMQVLEHQQSVIDLLESYLKAVCQIYSEQHMIRMKRVMDCQKMGRLESDAAGGVHTSQRKISNSSGMRDDTSSQGKTSDEEWEGDELDQGKHAVNETALAAARTAALADLAAPFAMEDDQLTAEELQMFESENAQLYNELNSLSDEVRQIERRVVKIAELQDVFTEKVLQQERDVDRISTMVVGATENVRDANTQIRQAIQRNAGLRVYVLFFLLVMSFSLLFLDWYND